MQLIDLLPDAPPTLDGDEAVKEKEGAVCCFFCGVDLQNGEMF